mgnify:CR=1 FL=1
MDGSPPPRAQVCLDLGGRDGHAAELIPRHDAALVVRQLADEAVAPSGYYQPLEQTVVEHDGRRLLYTLGMACIEASCCGVGSWSYARVEGYLAEEGSADSPAVPRDGNAPIEVDTIETTEERATITRLLTEKHPGVRVEFR